MRTNLDKYRWHVTLYVAPPHVSGRHRALSRHQCACGRNVNCKPARLKLLLNYGNLNREELSVHTQILRREHRSRGRGRMAALTNIRRALWHLRNNGVDGLRKHLSRKHSRAENAEARGVVSPSTRPPAETHTPAATIMPTVEEWPVHDYTVRRPTLTIALEGPEWLHRRLRPECALVDAPSATMNSNVIDILLVATPFPSRPSEAEHLIRNASSAGIPTVLWDTVGSLGADDSDAGPLPTSSGAETLAFLVDVAFTTHVSPLPGVVHLPLAVQPSIHNPARTATRKNNAGVVLIRATGSDNSGTSTSDSVSDSSLLSVLVDGTVDALPRLASGFDIFGTAPITDAPHTNGSHTVRNHPAVAETQRDTLLHGYAVGLDSHVGSPGICSSDVLEMTACGTAALTSAGPGIDAIFLGTDIMRADTRPNVGFSVRALTRSRGLRDRMIHRAQRTVWSEHTYSHRLDAILNAISPTDSAARASGPSRHVLGGPHRTVTAVVSSIRPEQFDHVLAAVRRQTNVDVQLAYLAHGWDPNTDDLRARALDAGIDDLVVLTEPAATPLGTCLNRLREAADGDVIAKIDDDDHYGPHYLEDSLHALKYSGSDVVGKQAHYVHLVGPDVTALRFPEREHRFTNFVVGPTIVTTREVAHAHPFPNVAIGEDSGFLRNVMASGGRIYSADKYGFALARGGHTHTWQAHDVELLANADTHLGGFNASHVDV